jgi:plastocyanin domain-containing protein
VQQFTQKEIAMKRFLWLSMAVLALAGVAWGCVSEKPAAEAVSVATEEAPESAPTAESAVQTTDAGTTVTIYVTSEGFVPANVHVPAGKPVTLQVTRKTEKTCATELVMAAKNIRQALPLNEMVAITFTPDKAGDLRFACGMDMVAGTITVE